MLLFCSSKLQLFTSTKRLYPCYYVNSTRFFSSFSSHTTEYNPLTKLTKWKFPEVFIDCYKIASSEISEISQNLMKFQTIENPRINEFISLNPKLYKYFNEKDTKNAIYTDSYHILLLESFVKQRILNTFKFRGNIRHSYLFDDITYVKQTLNETDSSNWDLSDNTKFESIENYPKELKLVREIMYNCYYQNGKGLLPSKYINGNQFNIDRVKSDMIDKCVKEMEGKIDSLGIVINDDYYGLYNPLCDTIWYKLDYEKAVFMLESMIKADTIFDYNLSCSDNWSRPNVSEKHRNNYSKNINSFIRLFSEYFKDEKWNFYSICHLDKQLLNEDFFSRDEMICCINDEMNVIFGLYCYYNKCYG